MAADQVILDPQGEPIHPADVRVCATCSVRDHKDNGARCQYCLMWTHEDCLGECDKDEAPHFLCSACEALDNCPACKAEQEEDAEREEIMRMRP